MREEYGYERIVTVTVDVGQPKEDIEQAEAKAKILGTEHYTVDAKEEFARDFCFAALKANGDYQGSRLHRQRQRPV
jgi:argininosuccinate synthase